MNNYGSYTIYFKSIFPTENDFIEYVNSFMDNVDAIFVTKLYKYLFRRYCNCSINYDTIEAFKRYFSIDFENEYRKYKLKRNIIDKIYNFDLDNLSITSKNIYNTALNNNELVENPLSDLINYVSNQQSTISRRNDFESYIEYVNKIIDENIYEYIDIFAKHFYQIFGQQIFIYNKEE